MAKKYKVGFKTINAKLEVTMRHLNDIKGKVSKGDRGKIEKQIAAIKVILAACGHSNPRMSATYTGGGND